MLIINLQFYKNNAFCNTNQDPLILS